MKNGFKLALITLPIAAIGVGVLAFVISNSSLPERIERGERVNPVRVIEAKTRAVVPRIVGHGVVAPTRSFEAIAEVGGQGHFFGLQHTQDRYETAFYSPFLSDWQNYENFRDNGAVWTAERANKIWKQILNEFEAPPMDEAIREELVAFVAKRKEEGGAPTDF